MNQRHVPAALTVNKEDVSVNSKHEISSASRNGLTSRPSYPRNVTPTKACVGCRHVTLGLQTKLSWNFVKHIYKILIIGNGKAFYVYSICCFGGVSFRAVAFPSHFSYDAAEMLRELHHPHTAAATRTLLLS